MNVDTLTRTTPPWFFLVACDASSFTNLLLRLRTTLTGGVVRHLRGSKMRTRDDLFDEISAALQFPYYFGENWDALDECMNDLEWHPGGCHVVGIIDAADVLSAEEDDQLEVFGRLLTSTSEEWATPIAKGEPWDRPAIPFHVLLHCELGTEPAVLKRYERAGWRVDLERVRTT
jgi:RNAse (barnase) inhibitor barstar